MQIPEMRAGLVGVFVFGVLGFACNDSGISIPGVMIGVVNSTLVFLVFLLWKRTPGPPARAPLDAPDPVAAGVGTRRVMSVVIGLLVGFLAARLLLMGGSEGLLHRAGPRAGELPGPQAPDRGGRGHRARGADRGSRACVVGGGRGR